MTQSDRQIIGSEMIYVGGRLFEILGLQLKKSLG